MKPSIQNVGLKSFALALSFISYTSQATERTETYLLVPGFINCFERGNLEKVLDQKSSKEISNVAKQMHKEGLCVISSEYHRVANVKIISNGPISYKCYQLWDITRPVPPPANTNEACSSNDSITTLKKAKSSRRGNYELVDNTEVLISANCSEGGNVLLMKSGPNWIRKASIPFGTPLIDQTNEILVSGAVRLLIRQGCKGIDY